MSLPALPRSNPGLPAGGVSGPGRSGSGGTALGTWWPTRQRLAALAVLAGVLTAALLQAIGGPGFSTLGEAIYLILVVAALLAPAAISFQAVTGQLLLAMLLLDGGSDIPLLQALPGVAGVILTTELLASVARLDSPLEGRPRKDIRGALGAGLLGAGAFGVVALATSLPGPGGILAVILASGACALLAAVLGRR